MNTTRTSFPARTILAAVLILAVSASAELTFTRIAQWGGPYFGFGSGTAINSNGTVLFRASLAGGQTGYFTGSGSAHHEILTSADGYSNLSDFASINDAGFITFYAYEQVEFTTTPGVFSADGGSVNGLALKSNDPDGFQSFNVAPHINSNTVAFTARLNNNRYAVFTVPAAGGTPSVVVGNSAEWLSFGNPSINGNGLIGVWAYHSTGAKIITTSGSTPTTIADTSLDYTGFSGDVSINKHGQVAYVAYVTIGGTSYAGLYLSDASSTQTIAESTAGGGAYTNILAPCVNDSGVVSFFGELPDGREGIFQGPDPANSTVVIEGGVLGGRTISMVRSHTRAMNNVGQVAFMVSFTDGTSAVYRADPTGSTQENPVLGQYVDGGPENRFFEFQEVLTNTWVDPPAASGYTYAMTGASLFTGISDFPIGFDAAFTVSVETVQLGQFTPGTQVTFADYAGELGDLLENGNGVTHFTVSGIVPLVDPADPVAFPLRIRFSSDFADLTMTPILADTAIPGDCDNDGDLDLVDIAIFTSFWRNQNCDVTDNCHGADIDLDKDVDLIDFATLAANWE